MLNLDNNKDWTGNNKAVFTCNGASNHSDGEREIMDYYATEPSALELLLDKESFSNNVWECACGELHLSKVLEDRGYTVRNSDIVDRLHNGKIETIDFLNFNGNWDGDIITNPPYKFTFLESKSRRELFDKTPFETLYVSSSRLQCAKNGDFETYKSGTGTAVAYGWYIWRKGFTGTPKIKWFN